MMNNTYKYIFSLLLLVLYLGQFSVQGQIELSPTDNCTDCVAGNAYTAVNEGCNPPCEQCFNTVEIKGTTATGQSAGLYFFLNKSEVEAIMINHEGDWVGQSHTIRNLQDDYVSIVELYILTVNDQLVYGTFVDNVKGEGYFQIGNEIQFIYDQACSTCISADPNRKAVPVCECEDGYVEVYDQNYTCEIECGHQCDTCELGNLTECLVCKDDNFLPPSCLYPKVGYISKEVGGEIVYLQCAKKCTACKDDIDNCVPTSEVLTSGGLSSNQCAGLNRDSVDGCNCTEGYYDNKGQNKDCLQCPEYCSSCVSLSQCTSCVEQLNRELNNFTGQCECKRGYQASSTMKDVCKKCYMVSDQCVEVCPPNTVPNEQQMICETMEYQMVSHKVLIYILGVLILIIEIALCAVMKNKLFKNIAILKKEKTIRKILQAKSQKMDDDYEKNKSTTMFNTSSPIKSRKSRKSTKGYTLSNDKSNLDSTANINDTTPGGISSNQLIESSNQMISPLQDVEEESPHKNKLVKRQRSRFLSKKMSTKPALTRGTGSVDGTNNPGMFGNGGSMDGTPQLSDNRMLGIKEVKEENNDSLFGAKKDDNKIADFGDLEDKPEGDDQLNEEEQKEKEEAATKSKSTKKKRTTKRMSKVVKSKKTANEDN